MTNPNKDEVIDELRAEVGRLRRHITQLDDLGYDVIAQRDAFKSKLVEIERERDDLRAKLHNAGHALTVMQGHEIRADAAEARLAAARKLHPKRVGKDPMTLKLRDYCGNSFHPMWTPWPCDTARALGTEVEP